MDICLKVRAITRENFSAYGVYHGIPSGKPDFSCDRFDWYDGIQLCSFGNESFGMVCPVYTGCFIQPCLEQHKNTREILIPLDKDVVIVVAKPWAFEKENFSISDFAAFYVPRGTMVVMDEGVWHEAPMSLEGRSHVLVIYKQGTGEKDKRVLEMKDSKLTIRVEMQ